VGSIAATIHLGFQGSFASLRQQAGRAGRAEQRCVSIFIAFDGPLDQYFFDEPSRLLEHPPEPCHLNTANKQILTQHLLCAALELPLNKDDPNLFGPQGNVSSDI
jgi:DEAD/DEAH box helicase domain-containing protein